MSRVAKKADFITISIYSVLAAAVMYISAALGACVDLAANNEGKVDFDVLTGSLDSTMTDTKLVLSQVQAGGNAMKFPIFAAFGIGIYALMKITNAFTEKARNTAALGGQIRRRSDPYWINRRNRRRQRGKQNPVMSPNRRKVHSSGTIISF